MAVSFHKAVVGEKHFYHIAKERAATQRLALRLRREIDPARFLSMSYETLTGDPAGTARTICGFLGVLPRVHAGQSPHGRGEARSDVQ